MSREQLRREDPALARALDAFTVPTLPATFADRVAASAQTPRGRPPRDRRGPWSRRRVVAIGVVAAGLMSATAAAAGLFGDIGVTVPALSRLVARVAAEPIAPVAPKPVERRAERSPPPVATAEIEVAPEPVLAPPPTLRDVRRERAAERVAAGIERRIAERERRGLPVPPRLRDIDARLPLEIAARNPRRAAFVERVQQLRAARRDGVEPPPAAVAPQVERPRWRDMTPAQRAAARERLRAWRERRLERLGAAPADDHAKDEAEPPVE